MAKVKYVCNNCGFESSKWYGRCPECQQWNTFEEVEVPDKKSFSLKTSAKALTPTKIGTIQGKSEDRLSTGFEELNRVLGGSTTAGGVVPGSVILLSGDPGVGKSTLLLQLALFLAGKNKTSKSPKIVLYVTGEESESQVKLRAERIATESLSASSLFIVSTTDIDQVIETISTIKPDLVIVDSVQTMATTQLPGFPGSVPQIRYVAARLIGAAKSMEIPVFMVGHVTKEGIVAGPMLLSHMVDVVLYLEGEVLSGTRILRSFKNRFGDVSEVGIFVMEEKGLAEIADAANFFRSEENAKVPGSATAVIMEGSRPILVEIQALVVPSVLSFPRRVSSGIGEKRLELLLAVIQKHLRLGVERMDVFVNVIGGLKVSETAADLAVCLAIISSFKSKPLGISVAIGEIGLLGELKTVVNIDKRIKEAKKFGFKNIMSAREHSFLADVAKHL